MHKFLGGGVHLCQGDAHNVSNLVGGNPSLPHVCYYKMINTIDIHSTL